MTRKKKISKKKDAIQQRLNRSKKRRRNMLAIGVVIAALIGVLIFFAITNDGGDNRDRMGQPGSTHEHVDFKVYIDGKPLDFAKSEYSVKSRHVHIESGIGFGEVIHVHATNVKIGFFFESLGMKLTEECFTLDNGRSYCNQDDKTLKFFVKHSVGDWERNFEFGEYISENFDKLLITYGDEIEEELKKQLDSVTDLSRREAGLKDSPHED